MNPDGVSERASLFNDLVGRLVRVQPARKSALSGQRSSSGNASSSSSGGNQDNNSKATAAEQVQGILIAADPLTSSVILVTQSPQEESLGPAVSVSVFPHAESVALLEEGDDRVVDEKVLRQSAEILTRKFKSAAASETASAAVDCGDSSSPEELAAKKDAVKRWLVDDNHLQVQEDTTNPGRLLIQGGVTLEPPYSASSCRATNAIVLSRVRELIAAFHQQPQH